MRNCASPEALAAPPPSGAWQPCEGAAWRQFADLGGMELESGRTLPQVRLAFETWGRLNRERSNAVLILHALTGDAHVAGPTAPGQVTAGWFDALVGPGKAIDTQRLFVVAPNVLGGCSGSTGPASARADGELWAGDFPLITTRDQVRAEVALADHLGIDRFHLVLGASMGGHRAVEWAVSEPARVGALAVIASSAATSADQAAWIHTQVNAVTLDEHWHDGNYYDCPVGPTRGLGLARQIAHTTYRCAPELDERFARTTQPGENLLNGGRLTVQSYLDYHGLKLARRFDAGSYVALCRAMLSHDVGRGRGGVESALAGVSAETLIVAVDTDRLFPPSQSLTLATSIPLAHYREIRSDHGHDGFLIEGEQLAALLVEFLSSCAPRTVEV